MYISDERGHRTFSIEFYGNPELYDPTDTCRPTVGRLSADTLPTPTISSFFTVIYMANLLIELLKNQFAHRRL